MALSLSLSLFLSLFHDGSFTLFTLPIGRDWYPQHSYLVRVFGKKASDTPALSVVPDNHSDGAACSNLGDKHRSGFWLCVYVCVCECGAQGVLFFTLKRHTHTVAHTHTHGHGLAYFFVASSLHPYVTNGSCSGNSPITVFSVLVNFVPRSKLPFQIQQWLACPETYRHNTDAPHPDHTTTETGSFL